MSHNFTEHAIEINRRDLSGPALRSFFNIAEKWQLSNDQQMVLLGVTSRSTFFKWKKDEKALLAKDTLERISYILGIYKALQILIPSKIEADKWVNLTNNAPIFAGKTALDRMLSGNVADLYIVRQYLDAERGGWS